MVVLFVETIPNHVNDLKMMHPKMVVDQRQANETDECHLDLKK